MSNVGVDCFFCDPDSKKIFKIADLLNFYIVSDGAPLSEGHLLLIPRNHIPCFAALPKNLLDEYFESRKKITEFLTKNYGKIIIFEHGISGQTVKHAHLHFLPTKKIVIPQIKTEFKTKKIKDFPALKEQFEKNKKYLYIEEDEIGYDVLANNPEPGFFHSQVLADILNTPKDFNSRAKSAKKYYKKILKLWQE